MPTSLRPLQSGDHAEVQALFARHGWPQRSPAGWLWALHHNPARLQAGAEAGWVLEHEGALVGFLGNLPQTYHLDGQRLVGATCTSYVVDDKQRAHSVKLMQAFAAQPQVAFLHSATANRHSAAVYKLFRFKALTDPRANFLMRWVASDSAFLHCAMLAKGLASPALARPVARLAAPAWRWLRQAKGWSSVPQTPYAGSSSKVAADQLAPGGDLAASWDLWAQAMHNGPGLQLDRSAASLAWRLADPDQAGQLALIALRDEQQRLQGMCLLRALAEHPSRTPRAELIDWAVLQQTPLQACAALMAAAVGWAQQRGLPMLDAKRFTGQAADVLSLLKPALSALPGDANWVLTRHAALKQQPGAGLPWAMTGADGDDWFVVFGGAGGAGGADGPSARADLDLAHAEQGTVQLRHQLGDSADSAGVKTQHVDLGAGPLLNGSHQIEKRQAVQQAAVENQQV